MNTCGKCEGTGLIPFRKKDGAIVPFAWLNCDCKELEKEHYQILTPDLFDFAMSDSFRAFSYQYCGRPDPGYTPLEIEAPLPQEIIHRHSNMGKKEFDLLQQTANEIKYLRNKVAELQAAEIKAIELQAKKQPKGITTYKGIK